MASAEELRAAITASQEALRQAIADAGAAWEQSPGGEEWSPRQAAEHALAAELHFASEMAKALSRGAPERREFSLASADAALAELADVGTATGHVFAQIGDGDLETAVPFMENIPGMSDDVAGAMNLVAYHHNDHAGQIGVAE